MNSSVDDKLEPTLAYAVVFGGVIALGLPLNAVSLWILCCRHSHKSPSAVFMVNLALSDLLLVISLPLNVYFNTMGFWPLGNTACLCSILLFRTNIRSSSIFITLISVDRLLAIVFPLRSRHRRTASNAWKAAALTWLLIIAVNIPESLPVHDHLTSSNKTICSTILDLHPHHCLVLAGFQLVLIFLLLLVNVVSTASVSWTLCRLPKDSPVITNKVNIVFIFLMNLLIFCVCFLPLSIAVFTMSKLELQPLVCLATVNCCLDPPLYYFSMDNFWKKDPDNKSHQRTIDNTTELKITNYVH